MTAYLLLLFGALMCSIQFVFLKKFQIASGESTSSAMYFSMLSSLGGALYMLVLSGFKLEYTQFSIMMACFMGTVGMLTNIFGMKTMHMGNLSVYTLFMMLGGMIVPFFMGVLALHEKPSVYCLIATMLVILSLSLPVFEKKAGGGAQKSAKGFYLMCVLLFFLNGSYSCLSKLHQINVNAVSTYDLLFMVFTAEAVISGLVLASLKATKKSTPVKLGANSLLYCVLFALFCGTGGIFIISGAKTVNATVLYPIVTGGTVIFSALNGRVLFKEKLNKYVVSEILLAVAATVLFMF